MQANKKNMILVGALVGVFTIITASFFFFDLRINLSESYPLGLYKELGESGETTKGTLVLFCPPKNEVFDYALKQGWLLQGECESGSIPLIKKVVAVEGDKVTISNTRYVFINGMKQKNSNIYKLPYITKSQTLQKNEVFLMSDFSKTSFDARYFGALNKSVIITPVEPIYTFMWTPQKGNK